jgi:hypothetical protein
MHKRAAINLLLVTCIVALAVFLVPSGTDDAPPNPVVVSTIDPVRIDRITVLRAGKEELRFIKHPAGWQMSSPVNAPAHPDRIMAMLAVLNARSHAVYNPADLNPDQIGIRHPAVTLKLNEHEFQFGGAAPLDQRRYVLFRNRLHLLRDGLYQQLLQPPEFFILKRED